jgi:hypothetical protein
MNATTASQPRHLTLTSPLLLAISVLFALAQSGLTDPQAFVIHNTLSSGASHALLTPLIALVFGCAGGIAGALLASIQRPVAIALGVGELLLMTAGLATIGFASSLNRSERPPFIMFGLLALGATMVCVYPLLTAIRRQNRSS